MTDDAEFDETIIEESEPAQGQEGQGACAGQGRPPASEARQQLKLSLLEIMEVALSKHELRIELEAMGYNTGNIDDDDINLAPRSAIKVETGVGKSEQLRQAAATHYIPQAKHRKLPHRVLTLVPTHKLAGEARSKMPAGVSVAVWQGRGGKHLETGEPMCLNEPAVKAALDIGANVEKTACRSKTARCPFYETCHYQRQKPAARTADVLYAAHESAFQMPKPIGKGFGLVIIDESFWQDGIATKSQLVISSLADELKQFPVRDRNGKRLDNETMHLRDLIERLQAALDKMPDGYVQRQPLLDAGLLPGQIVDMGLMQVKEEASCATAGKLEWQRKVDAKLRPGASAEEQNAAVEKFGFLGQLRRRHRMWRALGDLIASSDDATGRLKIETVKTKSGPVRCLRILGRKEIAKKLLDLPMIVADATLPLDLVKHFLPKLQLALDLRVEAPHQTVTQLAGLPTGKSSLQALEPGKRTPEKEERVARKRQRLVDAVRHLAAGRRGLVITYQAIEDDFAGIAGVETGHFNAIEGVDAWRDVALLVTIGRPLPRPADIQDMAAAVTGKSVIAGDMIEELRPIGPGHHLQCRVYGVPEAEMIRAAVTEAAIEQAVGRARGVNRTAANPVEIFLVLNDVVVPGLPVDEVVTFPEIEPDSIDQMLARGWEPQMPADAAKLCPDLFRNREAAKKAYQRDRLRTGSGPRGPRLGTWPHKNISIRRCPQPPWVALLFQPCGRGQLPRFCMANSAKIPDPRAALEAALGPLVKFEVVEDPYQGAAPATGRAAE